MFSGPLQLDSLILVTGWRRLLVQRVPRCFRDLACAMDRHSSIVQAAAESARASGRSVVVEVLLLQLRLIAGRLGDDSPLSPFIALVRRLVASGSVDDMASAREAMWAEIERIEGNSHAITYRESALLRGLLPYPPPDDPNDDQLAWASEMIDVADSLPSYPYDTGVSS